MQGSITIPNSKKVMSKPILLHLPPEMLGQLNEISYQLGIARAELIRRCLQRDLSFVKSVELRELEGLKRHCSDQYDKRMLGA